MCAHTHTHTHTHTHALGVTSSTACLSCGHTHTHTHTHTPSLNCTHIRTPLSHKTIMNTQTTSSATERERTRWGKSEQTPGEKRKKERKNERKNTTNKDQRHREWEKETTFCTGDLFNNT